MQAPTTLAGDGRFNRLTAGAIGLALVAASVLGAATLNERVELPLIGGSSADGAPADTMTTAEIEFVEQNTWDYQPSANYATVERIRLIEDNSFDYASPVTVEEIRFLEDNVWERQGYAQPAGAASVAVSIQDLKFLEENVWEVQGQMIPPYIDGATDY
jgi:hypothetical protein